MKSKAYFGIALIFFIFFLWSAISIISLFHNGKFIAAKIVAKEQHVMEAGMYGIEYKYEFYVDTVLYTSKNVSATPYDDRYQIGDIVEIVYNENNFYDNRINDFFDIHYQYIASMLASLITAFIGYRYRRTGI